MKLFIAIAIVMICLASLLIIFRFMDTQKKSIIPKSQIRYVPLDDSYTIGDGVLESERYPNLLTKHLESDGFNIALVANPSISGRTSQDVLDRQLAILKHSNPTFATLLIGANDIVQRVTIQKFRTNLSQILDTLEQTLPDKKIITLTIPAFSATPYGTRLSQVTLVEAVIIQYNKIIKEEAEKRNLKIVDIFEISKEMADNPSLVAADDLHPSTKEYTEWVKLLFPISYNLLTSP